MSTVRRVEEEATFVGRTVAWPGSVHKLAYRRAYRAIAKATAAAGGSDKHGGPRSYCSARDTALRTPQWRKCPMSAPGYGMLVEGVAFLGIL